MQDILPKLRDIIGEDAKGTVLDKDGASVQEIVSFVLSRVTYFNTGQKLSDELQKELTKWFLMAFSNDIDFPTLAKFNEFMADRVYLSGFDGSGADIALAVALYPKILKWDNPKRFKFVNVCRWFDYIQNTQKLGFGFIKFVKTLPDTGKNKKQNNKKKNKAKKPKPKPKVNKYAEFGKIDLRVGRIVSVENHPTNDALYVEKIDVGEKENRQVVSGLAKFLSLDEMKGRLVVLALNLGEADIKGVASSGLVLCASNADKSQCQPILPHPESKEGERIKVKGVPEDIQPDAKFSSKKIAQVM